MKAWLPLFGALSTLALLGCRGDLDATANLNLVVVHETLPGGGGEDAGLLANDRVIAFHRAANPPANPKPFVAPVTSCLDLALLEIEQAPRGAVELVIDRPRPNGTFSRLRLPIPADEWRIRLRPETARTPADHAWESHLRAQIDAAARNVESAEAAYREVEAWARSVQDDRLLALVLINRTRFRLEMQHFDDALADINEALALRRKRGERTLATSQAWAILGQTQNRRQDFAASGVALQRAREIQIAQAPGSLLFAATENLLGMRAGIQEDFATANQKLRAALAIAEAKLPMSRNTGSVLINLGNVARHLGRSDEAERFQRRAFAIYRRIEPEGARIPDILDNLGNLAIGRGDLEGAERLYRHSLRLFRERQPNGPAEAAAISNLGLIALFRGDGSAAEALLLDSYALLRQLAPDSAAAAGTFASLAEAARISKAPARARDYADRALAIHRKIAPRSTPLVRDLALTANLALERGESARARADLAEARHLARELPPTSDLGAALVLLAELGIELNDLPAAQESFERALQIFRVQAPGSALEAAALAGLARLAEQRHEPTAALDFYTRSIAALDLQVGRLGGSDLDRARIRGLHAEAYRGAIRLEAARGEIARAYSILERSRARTLLDLLAERDLEPPNDLPADLREERARIEGELARLEAEGRTLGNGADSPQFERARFERLAVERRRLLVERSALVDRLRRASPRYAALTAPKPLDLAAARRTLDPDTLGLSYSVGDAETLLFVLFPEGFPNAPPLGLEVYRIAVARRELAAQIAAFRGLILAKKGLDDATYRSLADALSSRLLAPASRSLARAQRIAISPDGPLALLPFAALSVPAPLADPQAPAYWVSRWPHYTIASATLAEELRRRATDVATAPLVAFGDPRYPTARPAGSAPHASPPASLATRTWLGTEVRSRLALPPLPASAREVESIGRQFTPAILRLGTAASEADFLQTAPKGRRVHFAGHALLDSRFPLESALALSPPSTPSRPGDDGLLQAWEIFERLRLSADLVALSACDTALGQEAGGEGLLGLTRAFHFAGARTVLASLWSVLDRSSTDLMTRFYAHLAAGEATDRALALAQREMLGGPNAAPIHWAAFQLDGDPRKVQSSP